MLRRARSQPQLPIHGSARTDPFTKGAHDRSRRCSADHRVDRRHSDPLDVGDHPGGHWGLSGSPWDGRARGRRSASLLLAWPPSSAVEAARRRAREVRHEPPIPARRARYQASPPTADAGEGHMSNLWAVESQRSWASRLTSRLPVLRLPRRVLPAQWPDF